MPIRFKPPLALLPLLAFTVGACHHPVPPPVEGRENPYGRRQIMFDSPGLKLTPPSALPSPSATKAASSS